MSPNFRPANKSPSTPQVLLRSSGWSPHLQVQQVTSDQTWLLFRTSSAVYYTSICFSSIRVHMYLLVKSSSPDGISQSLKKNFKKKEFFLMWFCCGQKWSILLRFYFKLCDATCGVFACFFFSPGKCLSWRNRNFAVMFVCMLEF